MATPTMSDKARPGKKEQITKDSMSDKTKPSHSEVSDEELRKISGGFRVTAPQS